MGSSEAMERRPFARPIWQSIAIDASITRANNQHEKQLQQLNRSRKIRFNSLVFSQSSNVITTATKFGQTGRSIDDVIFVVADAFKLHDIR